MTKRWIGSNKFWHNKRVCVTGGGFLGSVVVGKLHERGAAEVFVPRKLTGFEGEIRWDTSKPNGQPRRTPNPSP